MIINNFIEFAEFAKKYNLKNTDVFFNYYNGYAKVCNCKPTLKQLYYEKTEKQYIEYLNSNYDYLKQKIECFNDSILTFKNKNEIIYTILIN